MEIFLENIEILEILAAKMEIFHAKMKISLGLWQIW
jgi:hypothetical protein